MSAGSDYIPIKTTIVGIEDEAKKLLGFGAATPPTPKKKRNIVTITSSFLFIVNDPNGPKRILPHAPSRIHATIAVRPNLGTGTLAGAFGWIGQSSGDLSNLTGSVAGDAFMIACGGNNTLYETRGTNELWAVADPTATGPFIISVFADYEKC